MEYKGKLYGKIGNKYFDTGKTSDDYDELLEQRNYLLEALKPLISQFEKIEPLYFKDRVILENAKKAISKTESYDNNTPNTNIFQKD